MGKIKGELTTATLNDTLMTVVLDCMFCFFIFGKYMIKPFFVTISIYLIIKYILIFILNRNNYAIFNLEQKQIYTNRNKKLEIEDLKIIIQKKKKYFNVLYRGGKYIKLIQGVNNKEINKLENWLKESGKRYVIENNISRKMKNFAFISIVFSMSLLYFLQIIYLNNNFSAVKVFPKKIESTDIEISFKKKLYKTSSLILSIPGNNYMLKDTSGDVVFMDADTGKKIIISEREEISFSNNKIVSFLLKNVIGLKNNYEIISKTNNSQYGLIYLMFKIITNKNIEELFWIEKGDSIIYIRIEKDNQNNNIVLQIFEKGNYKQTDVIIEDRENIEKLYQFMLRDIVSF